MNVIRAVLPVMRKQRSGHVISISSGAGLMGFEFNSACGAAKFGLEGGQRCCSPRSPRSASTPPLPEHLKPYLSNEEEAPAGPKERILNFEPNTTYLLHPDGSRSHNRAISGQAAALAADAFLQAQAEEKAEAANELPPETAAALEAAHDRAIGIALKAAEIADRNKDAAVEAAQAEANGAEQKAAVIYVKRGAWRRAERTRLRPGESIMRASLPASGGP
jgi:short subunit dehydrogenase